MLFNEQDTIYMEPKCSKIRSHQKFYTTEKMKHLETLSFNIESLYLNFTIL